MKTIQVLAVLAAMIAMNSTATASECLADRHATRGVACTQCHKTQPPKNVPAKDCLACHGSYKVLAAKTDNLDINPHDSHMGDVECTECHQGHKKPRLVCDQCHEFRQLKVR